MNGKKQAIHISLLLYNINILFIYMYEGQWHYFCIDFKGLWVGVESRLLYLTL